MQKIRTKEEIDLREQKNKRIFSIIMLSILLLGTVGYGFSFYTSDINQSESPQNSSVINVGNQWLVQLGGQNLYFSTDPKTAKEIPVEINTDLNSYYSKPLYISSESQEIAYEISSTLGRYASRNQPACYGNCTENLPEKSCDDNLIVWKKAENNRVYQNSSCIFIEGDMKAADAFLYKVFGIN